MEILMAIGIGTLFGTGLYLCLRRRTFQLILGLALLSHGTNLLILDMGRIRKGAPPIIQPGVTLYADSLVEALILTAIVIGFGMTAFLLVLSFRAYQESGTDSVNPIDPAEPNRSPSELAHAGTVHDAAPATGGGRSP